MNAFVNPDHASNRAHSIDGAFQPYLGNPRGFEHQQVAAATASVNVVADTPVIDNHPYHTSVFSNSVNIDLSAVFSFP